MKLFNGLCTPHRRGREFHSQQPLGGPTHDLKGEETMSSGLHTPWEGNPCDSTFHTFTRVALECSTWFLACISFTLSSNQEGSFHCTHSQARKSPGNTEAGLISNLLGSKPSPLHTYKMVFRSPFWGCLKRAESPLGGLWQGNR